MKRLLIVNDEFILPVTTGGRVRTWNYVHALKDRYELNLIHPYRHPSQLDRLAESKAYFANVWSVKVSAPVPKASTWQQRMSQFAQSIPWELDYTYHPEFAAGMDDVLGSTTFDVVLTRYIFQARYLFERRQPPASRFVLDLDDIEPVKLARRHEVAGTGDAYSRWRTRLNIATFERYHRRHLPSADLCIVCSEHDREYLTARRWSSRVEVIPNAIQLEQLRAAEPANDPPTLLFCGTLSYQPNVDGLGWFVRSVWPDVKRRHPGVRMLVVGRGAGKAIRALASDPDISVHSDVPDLKPYYDRATAVIVPLRIGGGTRIKILEAAGYRRPVVSTTIGAEGLDLVPGQHCLVEDESTRFAAACDAVLRDRALANRLVQALYDVVRSRFDAPVVFRRVRQAFESMEAQPATGVIEDARGRAVESPLRA